MENINDIDYTIKQRLEIVKIEERQRQALAELDKLIAKIENKNIELQALRETEEKCLVEIGKEAEGRVEMAMRKLTNAGQFMVDLEKKATLTVLEVKNRSKQTQDEIIGLLGHTQELVDRADYLKEQSEKVMAIIFKEEEDLHNRIQTNSEFEKTLKAKDKEIEIKSKKAEEKLAKIKSIAFWHKLKSSEPMQEENDQ